MTMNAIKTKDSRDSIDKRRSSVFSAIGDQEMVCTLLENTLPGTDPIATIAAAKQSSSLFNGNKDDENNEILLKQIRRKSKNFKDLVANYWNSAAATTKEDQGTNASSREAVAKQLRRKSEESIFGTFHPIDLATSGDSNRDSSSSSVIRAGRTASTSGPLFPSIDIRGIEKHILKSSSSSPNHSNTVMPELATSLSAVTAAERLSAIGVSVPSRNITTNTGADTNSIEESNSNVISEPGPYDIVCGRNNGAYNYIGNRRFRVTIEMNLQRYIESPSREDRTNVIKSIVWMLREQVGARFLKKETFKKPGSGRRRQPQYTIMTEKQAREKVGHCLRDLIAAARKGEQQEKKNIGAN